MSQDVVSFVLRFVREAGQEQGARWRGTVKHVQGSTERQFSQFGEALSFMQSHMNETIEAASKDSAKLAQSNPLLETTKLWGEFVPQYNKLVMDKMSEAVSKSASLPQQFGEAMTSMWQPAESKAGAEAGLEAKLDTLSEQLGDLTKALASLQKDVAELKEGKARRSSKS